MRPPYFFGQRLSMISPSFNDNAITLKTSTVWPENHSSHCLFPAKEPKALQISSLCSCELERLFRRFVRGHGHLRLNWENTFLNHLPRLWSFVQNK